MDYKKEWKLFKKEFNYRDGTFLALIGVLCIALVTLNVEHNKEHEWCEYFYNEYGSDM